MTLRLSLTNQLPSTFACRNVNERKSIVGLEISVNNGCNHCNNCKREQVWFIVTQFLPICESSSHLEASSFTDTCDSSRGRIKNKYVDLPWEEGGRDATSRVRVAKLGEVARIGELPMRGVKSESLYRTILRHIEIPTLIATEHTVERFFLPMLRVASKTRKKRRMCVLDSGVMNPRRWNTEPVPFVSSAWFVMNRANAMRVSSIFSQVDTDGSHWNRRATIGTSESTSRGNTCAKHRSDMSSRLTKRVAFHAPCVTSRVNV